MESEGRGQTEGQPVEQATPPAAPTLTLESLEQRVRELERCKHEVQHTLSDEVVQSIAEGAARLLEARGGAQFSAAQVRSLLLALSAPAPSAPEGSKG